MVRVGLFGFERRLARQVFEAILPSRADTRLPQLAHECPIDAYLTDLFRTAPGQVLLGVHVFLWLLMLSPALAIGRFTTFGRLSKGERLRVLYALKASRFYVLREIPLFFKALACFGVLSAPAAQSALLLEPRDAQPPQWALENLPE